MNSKWRQRFKYLLLQFPPCQIAVGWARLTQKPTTPIRQPSPNHYPLWVPASGSLSSHQGTTLSCVVSLNSAHTLLVVPLLNSPQITWWAWCLFPIRTLDDIYMSSCLCTKGSVDGDDVHWLCNHGQLHNVC